MDLRSGHIVGGAGCSDPTSNRIERRLNLTAIGLEQRSAHTTGLGDDVPVRLPAYARCWSSRLNETVHIGRQSIQVVVPEQERQPQLAEGVDLALEGFGRISVHFHSRRCCWSSRRGGARELCEGS